LGPQKLGGRHGWAGDHIADHADYYVGQNYDHNTNKRVNYGVLALLGRFLVAGGSDIPETADNEEQYRDAERYGKQPVDDQADKPVDVGRGAILELRVAPEGAAQVGESE